MSDRERLLLGIQALGLDLPAKAVDQLLAYRDLMLKWNRTYNLTALKDPARMVSHHLLDSLAILPWIAGPELLDVGSGAGLPGIPLAIARPDLRVTLVDAVQKKAAFQRQAAIELGLANVQALHGRVEELQGRYGMITSRAFADLADFVRLTRSLLAPGGRWLAMKGLAPEQELAALPAGVQVAGLHPLQVPGLDAARHLVILQAS
ncbi:16S rRNA (guanine(527)-N(7))-methyltransferase RsmG [Azovibrio restrictus]|uniref:16S rRNA (guanine(527)-N(7))-methyltransferase RsmG n=1 Tax=Azovibrio restrictus TaxID=146938 RepID=UPI0026EA470D|nr:16S rRNA (guanine(527)-N(7))-methyltransferase RsmG [Azovibrio restrictus]